MRQRIHKAADMKDGGEEGTAQEYLYKHMTVNVLDEIPTSRTMPRRSYSRRTVVAKKAKTKAKGDNLPSSAIVMSLGTLICRRMTFVACWPTSVRLWPTRRDCHQEGQEDRGTKEVKSWLERVEEGSRILAYYNGGIPVWSV
ncbi:hypothetical protein PG985_011161 [Apiospora marii]|uniref:uncharacterized protein n=1 Tax=Apiospora marii TaxID=335849 RepID=UPI0031316E35